MIMNNNNNNNNNNNKFLAAGDMAYKNSMMSW